MAEISPAPSMAWNLQSCADAEIGDLVSGGAEGEPWVLLPGESVGQLFRPRHDGLSAIEFFLTVVGAIAEGALRCSLREGGPSGQLLGATSLPLAATAASGCLRFSFPPVTDSSGRPLYASLETEAPGLAVYVTGLATPLGAYRSQQPVNASLVYKTYAVGPDARWADRATIEHLLGTQAELTRALVDARQALQALADERSAIDRRLQQLRDILMPTVAGRDHGQS